jgi:3-hydroxyisobutyrate dehydrogenase-like beta-hydroxyacid dehydrogenase
MQYCPQVLKLIGNLFLISMTAGVVDSFAMAKSLDIPPSGVLPIVPSLEPCR